MEIVKPVIASGLREYEVMALVDISFDELLDLVDQLTEKELQRLFEYLSTKIGKKGISKE